MNLLGLHNQSGNNDAYNIYKYLISKSNTESNFHREYKPHTHSLLHIPNKMKGEHNIGTSYSLTY